VLSPRISFYTSGQRCVALSPIGEQKEQYSGGRYKSRMEWLSFQRHTRLYGVWRRRQRRYYRLDLFCCPSPAAACYVIVILLYVNPCKRRRPGEGRYDERTGTATTAMWSAVWHGGRPVGRRATTRRIDLSCSARAPAAAMIMRESGRPPAGGGLQCGAALTGPSPAEGAAEGRPRETRKTMTDAA
jgi:hypothetical protein